MTEIKRRNWTPEDDVKLADMHTSGMRYPAMAKILGRTIEALESRRKLLGLPTFTELEKKSYR